MFDLAPLNNGLALAKFWHRLFEKKTFSYPTSIYNPYRGFFSEFWNTVFNQNYDERPYEMVEMFDNMLQSSGTIAESTNEQTNWGLILVCPHQYLF